MQGTTSSLFKAKEQVCNCVKLDKSIGHARGLVFAADASLGLCDASRTSREVDAERKNRGSPSIALVEADVGDGDIYDENLRFGLW